MSSSADKEVVDNEKQNDAEAKKSERLKRLHQLRMRQV